MAGPSRQNDTLFTKSALQSIVERRRGAHRSANGVVIERQLGDEMRGVVEDQRHTLQGLPKRRRPKARVHERHDVRSLQSGHCTVILISRNLDMTTIRREEAKSRSINR